MALIINVGDQIIDKSQRYVLEVIRCDGLNVVSVMVQVGTYTAYNGPTHEYHDPIGAWERQINSGQWCWHKRTGQSETKASAAQLPYPDGMNCSKCNDRNPYAIPNRGDKYLCYNCRT